MRYRLVLWGLTVLLAVILLPIKVAAIGIAIGPSAIEITGALRGSEYIKPLSVFNPGEESAQYAIGVEGEIASWIEIIDAGDGSTSISSITVQAKGNSPFLARIKILDDAANGIYSSTIYAETIPSGGPQESGKVSAKLRAISKVTITVSGTQTMAGEVESVMIRDVEVNYPLRVQAIFRNTGNVVAKPVIRASVNRDMVEIASFDSVETPVPVEGRETISTEWDTTGTETGKYSARVTVSLEDKEIASTDVSFEILPVGTLSREGKISDLTSKGRPSPGSMVKIMAGFSNTGQIDTKARFVGEVYNGEELVNILESEEVMVAVGETVTLASYFTPESEGEYRILGHVNYEGKHTDAKELIIMVTPAVPAVSQTAANPSLPASAVPNTEAAANLQIQNTSGNNSRQMLPLIIGVSAGLLVIALGIYFYLTRKKKLSHAASRSK